MEQARIRAGDILSSSSLSSSLLWDRFFLTTGGNFVDYDDEDDEDDVHDEDDEDHEEHYDDHEHVGDDEDDDVVW